MRVTIACIVEGDGEVEAVPLLLRRLGQQMDPPVFVEAPRPIRSGRYKIIKHGELERAVRLAAKRAGKCGPILVLLDSEDDCPGELGPRLFKRAISERRDIPLSVALAKKEYEGWFLAAARSLRGQRSLSDALEPPLDPEAVRGAKEWLNRNMSVDGPYREVLHQPALTAIFDLEQAATAPSFRRFVREVHRLFEECRLRGKGLFDVEPGGSGGGGK